MKSPFKKAFSLPNIKLGSAKCGIYPFNHNAVSKLKMTPSSVHMQISSSTCTESESPTPNPPSECSGASASDSLVSELSQSGAEPCTNQQSPPVSPTPITSALSTPLPEGPLQDSFHLT